MMLNSQVLQGTNNAITQLDFDLFHHKLSTEIKRATEYMKQIQRIDTSKVGSNASSSPKSSLQVSHQEQVSRTVFISNLATEITEDKLSLAFLPCGEIVECRICGSSFSATRKAFIEFRMEISARIALGLTGMLLGNQTIKVAPSKTAIIPVDKRFLPKSDEERASVARTVYIANIDDSIETESLKVFLECTCGAINRMRLLSDGNNRNAKFAFVEFMDISAAKVALSRSGMMLRKLKIRVSPSKTPLCSKRDFERKSSPGIPLPMPGASHVYRSNQDQDIRVSLPNYMYINNNFDYFQNDRAILASVARMDHGVHIHNQLLSILQNTTLTK